MHEKYLRPTIQLDAPMPERRIEQARSPKIIICKVALEPRAFLDTHGEYAGAYTTYVFANAKSLHYLTGILNSTVIKFAYRCLYDALAMGGGYLRFQPPQVRRIPIRVLELSNPTQRLQHDRMTTFVEQMIILKNRTRIAKTSHEQIALQRQIEATDREIDQLVYELYGLTDEEIRIVEEATA